MRFDLDNAFGIHEQAVVLRSKRAQVLSENLANADTPGYKAKDLDFQSAMDHVREEMDAGQLRKTNANHIGMETQGPFGSTFVERVSTQPSLDGNTVDTQIEQSAFLRNAIEYQVSLRLLDGKIKGLMSAIKGE